jgi:quinoprotein glucose dehydrogenase
MRPLCFLLAAFLSAFAIAAEPVAGDGTTSKKDDRAPAPGALATDPALASKRFTIAPGLQCDLWAAEPLIQNVVAFSFDERGRAYVVETGRRRTSVPDIRKHMDWLLPSLAFRTVQDRAAFFKNKSYPSDAPLKSDSQHEDINGDGHYDWQDLAVESERIRLVEDRDGDGVADNSIVFADGFNFVETGVAAGVLATGGNVYFACIPNLWKFAASPPWSQPASTGAAIATGFGVHIAYGGHDMHGVKMGPDGRLYWSIADCGARAPTEGGKMIDAQDYGAVFRSEPDGSKLELYAKGLRNPESLAFNDVGDLFTGDNNADGGDKARWEHIVEGADYGWRIGWQFLPKLGAWNSELLWEMNAGETAYSQLPPVAHIGHGPSGIAYYPGTGLPERFANTFFYADFPGGVRSFTLERKGASYTATNAGEVLLNNKQSEMTNKLLWGLYPTDVQFGVDGGAYVLDWVEGWEKTGKGRIFRVHDPAIDASAAVKETKEILARGFTGRTEPELVALLGHGDQRVRLGAQYALVAKPEIALPLLTTAATAAESPRLQRLHAIWALGQLGRKTAKPAQVFTILLTDEDADVRGQAARMLGECMTPLPTAKDVAGAIAGLTKKPVKETPEHAPVPRLIALLQDAEPRVRFFSAQALGKLKATEAVPALLALAEANADKDPYIRHAVSMALVASGDITALTAESKNKSDAVRAVVLLALRRLGCSEVGVFLRDAKPQLVLEAARAIHDEPIDVALPELASVAVAAQPMPVARRIVNANFRVGTSTAADALGRIAQDASVTAPVRLDALEALAQWNEPLGRDRLLGTWRAALPGHDSAAARKVAATLAPRLLHDPAKEVQLATLVLVASSKATEAEPGLLEVLHDAKADGAVRAETLRALSAMKSARLNEAVEFARASNVPLLTAAARRLSSNLTPAEAVAQALAALDTGEIADRRAAFQSLATFNDPSVEKALGKWVDRLASGKVPAALQLDVLEAAAASKDDKIAKKLAEYQKSKKADDPMARFRECLEGGDSAAGRLVFFEKAEAACLRCHKVKGEGGDVGPDLAGIAAKHDRTYILKSIVAPNAEIAPGFESVMLTLNDGSLVVGIASAEDAQEYTITPLTGGDKTKVKKAAVKQRDKVPSPMPEGLGEVLGARDLRDLVEYLASLK